MVVNTIFGLIVALILAMYVVAPIIIYRSQKVPGRVKFLKLDENEFLNARSEIFSNLDSQIKALDFEYVGSSKLEDTHNTAYFSLYSNKKSCTTGMLVTMDNNVNSFTYAEFSQLYSDGTMLDVSNASVAPVYPRMPLKIAARFPDINELEDLYGALLKLKSSLNNTSASVPYGSAYGFDKVEEFMGRESDELVKMGYCREDIDDDGKRSLTLKGAFIFTWKNVFPIKQIYDALDQSYSRKMLNNA